MNSAIYVGRVKHRRSLPVPHAFEYRMHMMFLDLAELPGLFRGRWFWSSRRFALGRFRREDHFGDTAEPLDESIRKLVEAQTGRRPEGRICLLTQLRYFGFVFNPVSFYYCFEADGKRVQAIVAEVNNTPWGERHCYVLPADPDVRADDYQRFQPAKVMHVSPFMEMDVDYRWRFSPPRDLLTVFMENLRDGNKVFDATLILERKALSATSLAGLLLRFPPMTVKIIAGIYWQALRLWLKGAPVHAHPDSAIKHVGDV